MGYKGQSIFDKYGQIITMLVESNMSQEFIARVKEILISIADDFDNNEKLTIKEKEAIDYVNSFITTHGKPPSYEDVSNALGISRTSAYARLRNYRFKMKTRVGKNLIAEQPDKIEQSTEQQCNIHDVVGQSEQLICRDCGKYKTLQGNGIMHQLCECGCVKAN